MVEGMIPMINLAQKKNFRLPLRLATFSTALLVGVSSAED